MEAALMERTGQRTPGKALIAWINAAKTSHSAAEIKAAIQKSSEEDKAGRGRRFKTAREAVRWLER
jgi:hypothetical protein